MVPAPTSGPFLPQPFCALERFLCSQTRPGPLGGQCRQCHPPSPAWDTSAHPCPPARSPRRPRARRATAQAPRPEQARQPRWWRGLRGRGCPSSAATAHPPNRSHSHLAPASRPSGLAAAGGTPPGKRWGARRGRRVAVAGAVARSGAGQGCLCAKSGTSPGGGEHCGMRGQAARAALRGGGRGRSGDAAGLAQASGRCTAGGRRAGVRRGREGARERSWRGLGRCPSQCSCPPQARRGKAE